MKPSRLVLLSLVLPSIVVSGIYGQSDDAEVANRVRLMAGIAERDEKQPGRPVVSVELGHAIADGNLAFLRKARHLRRLKLNSDKITDASADELARFTTIEDLEVRSRNITGSTLKQIGKLTQLKQLSLSSPNLKDKDLAHLCALVNLIHLNLEANELSDDALAFLGPLPKLWTIGLGKTRMTDAAIPALLAMPKLKSVSGDRDSKMTEAGRSHLWRVLRARYEYNREHPGNIGVTSGPTPAK